MASTDANLRVSALNYLKRTNALAEIEDSAVRYVEENRCNSEIPISPLILHLELSFPLLFDESQQLYTFLETDCVACRELFQEVIYEEITRRLITLNKTPPMGIQLVLSCIPFTPRTLPTTTSPTALFAMRTQVLVSKTTPIKYKYVFDETMICGEIFLYVLPAYFITSPQLLCLSAHSICILLRCPDKLCLGYLGQYKGEFQSTYYPSRSCIACGKQMKEDVRGRAEGERVMASFLPIRALRTEIGRRYDPYLVAVTGLLANDLELGVEYDLLGRVEGRWFELWGIGRTVTSPLAVQPYILPKSIQTLRNYLLYTSADSPWAFAATLATQLCRGIFPENSYRHLKMGLLLSLASTSSNFPIPIMCIGPDTWGGKELMRYAANLAPRNLPVSYPVGGLRQDTKDQVKLEAGCFVMTRTGVCIVKNWDTLRPVQTKSILSAIDNDRITMESRAATPVRTLSVNPDLPLRTAVWTYWGYLKNKNHRQILDTSISVFGVPFLSDSKTDNGIATYILENAVNNVELSEEDVRSGVTIDDFREFLMYVNVTNVVWSTEAAQLSNDYFVASRMARGDCLPIRSITVIKALAESHTKLSLRTEVTEADVITIIALYEESLCYLYGTNISTPPNCFKNVNINDNDRTMLAFNVWLRSYLKLINLPGGITREE